MLKLKYLFNNVYLAEMLLANWEFDKQSIDMFKHYRISSNAIYPFAFKGNTQLLRFAPKTEKFKENILAELDFIAYLRKHHYGVLESVLSINGEELVELQTPWGEYFASVFKRVSGVQMNKTDFSDAVIFSYGKALGKLHQLSSEYTPTEFKRWSYTDVLNWMQDILMDHPQETAAVKETELLRNYFSSIPMTKSNYGLIHYDFEYDNVFYDEASKSCNVIDFDDAMYHWYVLDIAQALDSLQDHIPTEIFSHNKQCFIDGYRTEFDISDMEVSSILPACKRFANLYGYVRTLRSIVEEWANEPDWLINLRGRLSTALEDISSKFSFSPKYFMIECQDIILREYRIDDLDELYDLTQQSEILEFLPGWNTPKEQRFEWLVNYETIENKQFINAVSESGSIGQLRLRLGIISKETGEFIGWCCTGIKLKGEGKAMRNVVITSAVVVQSSNS